MFCIFVIQSKSNNNRLKNRVMKATTIAHLVGRMDMILEMIEFSIQQIDIKDYQKEFLMEQIQKANAVNDEIFEMHKRNELNRIKKTYNDGSDENK